MSSDNRSDESHSIPFQHVAPAELNSLKGILGLPTELILRVFHSLASPDERLHGVTQEEINTLCNTALTCRKLRPITREVLLHTTVIEVTTSKPPIHRLVTLIRFLFKYPDMAVKIRNLRIDITTRHDSLARYGDHHMVLESIRQFLIACEKVMMSKLQKKLSDDWPDGNLGSNTLDFRCGGSLRYEDGLTGILLFLASKLEKLHLIATNTPCSNPAMFFGINRQVSATDILGKELSAGLASIKYLKFSGSCTSRGINVFPNLQTLDLSCYAGADGEPRDYDYPNVTVLRLNSSVHLLRHTYASRRSITAPLAEFQVPDGYGLGGICHILGQANMAVNPGAFQS